ncbi:hypothetical protein QE357_002358 [Siphonobacter sp. BAB-5404]|nr:hypothetical protein [Siphonobacter sp. SORGH_AS_0500]
MTNNPFKNPYWIVEKIKSQIIFGQIGIKEIYVSQER